MIVLSFMGTRTEHKEDFVDGGFGLGLQEHFQDSCCSRNHKGFMVLPHHHHHNSYSSSFFSSSSCCYGCDGGSSTAPTTPNGGPLFCASTNIQTSTISCLSDMYCHVGSGSGGGGGSGASAAEPSFTLSFSGDTGTCMSEKADSLSAAQWQELERQTTIYSYMMASVPVPAELLVPISRTPTKSNPNAARGGSLKLGISSTTSNNTDPEPWRCRRTDGKKWRCSRDVVPDQKYCERHSHKSRPRSRKPVELPPHIVSHAAPTTSAATVTKNTCDPFASHTARTCLRNPHLYGQTETQFPVYSTTAPASSPYDHYRGLSWFMKEDDAPTDNASNLDLGQMVHPKLGSDGEHSKFGGSIGFDYNQNFAQKDELVRQSLGSLEGLLSLNQTTSLETRHFIDAWSKPKPDVNDMEAMGSTNCSLTLSVAGTGECSSSNEEAENSQLGTRPPWMSHEGSWMGSTPGGPLAEALCLGVANKPRCSPSGCSVSNTSTSSCSRSSS